MLYVQNASDCIRVPHPTQVWKGYLAIYLSDKCGAIDYGAPQQVPTCVHICPQGNMRPAHPGTGLQRWNRLKSLAFSQTRHCPAYIFASIHINVCCSMLYDRNCSFYFNRYCAFLFYSCSSHSFCCNSYPLLQQLLFLPWYLSHMLKLIVLVMSRTFLQCSYSFCP